MLWPHAESGRRRPEINTFNLCPEFKGSICELILQRIKDRICVFVFFEIIAIDQFEQFPFFIHKYKLIPPEYFTVNDFQNAAI